MTGSASGTLNYLHGYGRVACSESHREVAELLLAQGADINYRDADGRSTLYVLALENRLDTATFLLDHGAHVEAADLEGRTPLHVAAWQGHFAMVMLLLKHKVRVGGMDQVCACVLSLIHI